MKICEKVMIFNPLRACLRCFLLDKHKKNCYDVSERYNLFYLLYHLCYRFVQCHNIPLKGVSILKKKIARVAMITICFHLCSLLLPCYALADVPLKDKYDHTNSVDFDYELASQYTYYSSLLDKYDEYGYRLYTGEPLAFPIEQAVSSSELSFSSVDDKNALLWTSNIDYIQWDVQINISGLYRFELDYYLPKGAKTAAARTLYLNGEIPFYEASNLAFRGAWKDASEPKKNSLGDDIWPSQEPVLGWQVGDIRDTNENYKESFELYLKEGAHQIRFAYVTGDMYVGELRVMSPNRLKTYEEVYAEYNQKGYSSTKQETLTFEAEQIVSQKTDTAIRREYSSDPLSLPYSYINRRLNVIGGERWKSGGQSLTMTFSVPQSGLYKVGFHLYQNYNDGLPSYRRIAIDGTVPFSELYAYQFNYSSKWQTETLSDDKNNPYLFYLEEGPHTITLTVTTTPYLEIIHSLNDDSVAISALLNDITQITGTDPDFNYDYKLTKTIPGLLDSLQNIIDSLQYKHELISTMSKKTTSMASNFLTIIDQLQAMKHNPFSIPRHLDELSSAVSSLGTWYTNIQEQPLLLDNLMIASADQVWIHQNSSLWSRLWGSIISFFMSFTKDYNSIGDVTDGNVIITDTISVWVSYGSEWAEQIKELADTTFTPEKGIAVKMNILPAGQLNAGTVNALMLSITSGKAPDVALGVASNSPVEFAIRDATHDLSEFSDFEEIKGRFLENIFTPFLYNDGTGEGVYALPETMGFNVMFYRKDILADLGLSLPNTREELYSTVLPVLYQNNKQFYYPVDYSQFIYQYGADYYTEDGLRSALDTPEAYQAFKECVELYSNYGVPVSADFYNRFRSGEMPIGISNFSTYVLLSTAAPELAGRWGIAPLPGLKKPDGTIDRSSGGLVGGAAIILEQSTKKDSAWEFLKWWTSTETQESFAYNIESLIGLEARWPSANIEAFSSLPWNQDDLKAIQNYWSSAKEMPVVLGGYYTSRHMSNAWNRIINNSQSVRDALEEAVFDINRELRAKQEEYGFYE